MAQDFETIVAGQDVVKLPVSITHARMAGEMNIAHKEQFDRFLIAQAQAKGAPVDI